MRYFIFLIFFFSVCLLAQPAHRIISLAPNITEIAFAAGAGKYIIGTSTFSDFPPLAKKIPVVATYDDLDMERMISLHPDLIIVWKGGTPMAQIAQLKKLGIPIYIASFRNILDIPKTGLKIGELAGTERQAKKFATQFKKHYEKIKNKNAKRYPVPVFYQLSLYPLITLNDQSSAGQIIQLCGGKNIFGQTIAIAPQISIENVLTENPDVILISSASGVASFTFWKKFMQLNAVKNHRIYLVNDSLTQRYGPRILEGAEQVCTFLGTNHAHYQ
ncbi:MAG: cobalamin-binding protein [Gammaproteobacteria bacterium]|nr:cobalamin-binding protein [Gammaproteobacteria bacterium]